MANCRRCIAAVLFAVLTWSTSLAIDSDQQKSIDRIAAGLKSAGALYQQGEYKRCATMIGGAQRLIEQLVESGDQEVIQQLRPLHRMLAKAHALLRAQGVELDELPPMPGEQIDPLDAQLTEIRAAVTRGGSLFTQKNFAESAAAIASAQQQLNRLVIPDPGASYDQAKQLHAMIAKAHELLSDKKVELPELGPLPPPGARTTSANANAGDRPQAISFGRDIAPILTTHCGNCHVRESKGELSLANFQSILKGAESGPAVSPGRPDGSVLLQLVESGDMPPQRGRQAPVPAADVQQIRMWIEQGAPYDGASPTTPIAQVIEEAQRAAQQASVDASGRPLPAGESARPQSPSDRANGRPAEPVSFALEIVPILITQCGTCHMRSTSGGVSINSFQDLVAERRGGRIVDAQNPAQSLMLTLVEGNDPTHQDMIRDADLKKLRDWLQSGARFDGNDETMQLQTLMAQAQSEAQRGGGR